MLRRYENLLHIADKIAQADTLEIEMLLNAVLMRYAQLFPDWEICTISLQQDCDRNEQLDRIIDMLQKMKTSS